MSKEEATSKLIEMDDKGLSIKREERFYPDGDPYKEKFELYLCRFELYGEKSLPEDGHVEKSKLVWMEPSRWVIKYIKKKTAA